MVSDDVVRVDMMNNLSKIEVLSKSPRDFEIKWSNVAAAISERNGSAFAFLFED